MYPILLVTDAINKVSEVVFGDADSTLDGTQFELKTPELEWNWTNSSFGFGGLLNDKEFDLGFGNGLEFNYEFGDLDLNSILGDIPGLGGLKLDNTNLSFSDGFNFAGSVSFDENPDGISKFISQTLGVKDLTIDLDIASSGASLSGNVNGDVQLFPPFGVALPSPFKDFFGDFSATLNNANLSLDVGDNISGTVGGSIALEGYDPFQDNEPLLNLAAALELDPQELTGKFEMATEEGTTWSNVFGLPQTELRNITAQIGGTYTNPSFIDNIGFVGDLKFGAYNFESAILVDTNDPQKFALQLTLNEPLSLIDMLMGPSYSYALTVAEDQVKNIPILDQAGDFFTDIKNLIPMTVVSIDDPFDDDEELDPLIKVVPVNTKIFKTELTAGLGINGGVDVFGKKGSLNFNADIFSSNPNITGSLKIEEIDVANLGVVKISGVENPASGIQNTDLNLDLKVSLSEQYFQGDGQLEILGREVAKVDFKVSPSGIEIKNFDFDLLVTKLDVNDLNVYTKPKDINGVSVIAQGNGSFKILGHEVTNTDFHITTSGIDINNFNLDVGVFELNVNDFSVDFNNLAANGQANVKVFNQEIAAVDFDVSSQNFELKDFDLDFGMVNLDVDNLSFDTTTRDVSGSGVLEIFGKTFASAQIQTIDEKLRINSNLNLGLINIDNATIDVNNSEIKIEGITKYLGEQLTNAQLTLIDNKLLKVTGNFDLLLPGSLSKVNFKIEITYNSEGSLKDLKLTSDLTNWAEIWEDLQKTVKTIESPKKLISKIEEIRVVELAAKTWNDTVDVASDTWKALGGEWSYDTSLISNTLRQVSEEVYKTVKKTVYEDVVKRIPFLGNVVEKVAKTVDTVVFSHYKTRTTHDPDWSGTHHLNYDSNRFDGRGGNDRIYGKDGNDSLVGSSGNDSIYGDGDDDKLRGGNDNDYLDGGDGNDQLYGESGTDRLYGGNNDDYLNGGDGNDSLYGGNGNDKLEGHNGDDYLSGQGNNDLLNGGSGNDRLYGGSGSDQLDGGSGNDTIDGGNDNDRVYGNSGSDSLQGGNGDDEIHGGYDKDTLKGNSDSDILYGQQHSDLIYGGDGNDYIYGEDNGKQGQSYDQFYTTTKRQTFGWQTFTIIERDYNNDTLYGENGDDYIVGGIGDDYLDGGTGEDYIDGGSGNDKLYGGEGDDYLDGGEGSDTLDPGTGNDIVFGGAGEDFLVLSGEKSDYTFTETSTGWIITDNRDNSEKTVTGVEQFLYKLEGSVANGPLANATAFIDTNGNFQLDAGETQTTTDNNGEYDFAIDPEALDRNGDGEISPQEAQIVVTGGIDTTTGLPGAIPLISQVGSTSDHATTSPLTTLKAVLASQDIEADQVETLLNKISGLDLASLSQPLDNFDPYAAVGESDTSGVDIASGHIKIMNLFINGSTFLEAAGYQGEDAQIQFIMGISEVLQTVNSFDLSQSNDLQTLFTQLTEQLNLSVNSEVVASVSELVAQSNHLVDELVEEALSRAVSDVLPTINPIKQAVYSQLPEVTAQLVEGEITTELAQTQLQDLLNSDTFLVEYALNENRTVTVTASNTATSEDNSDSEAEGDGSNSTTAIVTEGEDSHGHFIITLGEAAPAQGLKILYTLSGTATLGQDYESENGQFGEIIVAPGETEAVIDLTILDDDIAERPETITINLRYVGDGYVLDPEAQSAVLDITDNDEANAADAETGLDQTGTSGDDTLIGTDAEDYLSGSYGDDMVFGQGGNDDIMGAAGEDTVFGGKGNDNIEGNFGADVLHGNKGDDILAGGSDNDIIEGHEGSDQLQGDSGDDYLQGNEGNDVIKGGLGNDLLKGNQDNDWLIAGSGDDILMGGQGVDLFNGGDGADVFFFNVPAEGSDLILDFDPTQGDKIQVSEIGFNTTSLEDFSFMAGTLYFQDQELALVQNNGQTYNNFADLSNILEIVSEPTRPEVENTAVLSANITPRVPDINLVDNPETTILDEIIQRGQITVATPTSGVEFDLEFARTLAAALFGDASKVETVTTTFDEAVSFVADGSVDLSAQRSTQTLGRDATLNVDFSPTYFYDHQAVVVRNNSGIDSILDLNGRTIGVIEGTTALEGLYSQLGAEGIEFIPQQFATAAELMAAYDQGLIDAYSRDRTLILDHLESLSDSGNHRLLDVEFSKEPIALALPENDSQWADIVRWVNYVPVQAEEFGIDSQNIDQLIEANTDENENNDSAPEIRRFLGLEGDLGEALGLPNDFAVQVIRQVGNYSEIYDRHFPELDRNQNLLWTDGGLLYSPPFSGSPIDGELVDNNSRNLLAEVLERGSLKLGLPGPGSNPGFAIQQEDGEYVGFDVDLGRAIAAAVFGDASKLEIQTQSFTDSFANTANGVVDVSAMGITENLMRDASLGIDYSPTYLYTGQGILVKADSGIDMLPGLNGRRIGVLEGATALQNLQDNLSELGGTFTPVTYGSNDALFAAYEAGEIDAVSTDMTILSARIPTLANPEEHQLLDDVLSKEPLALITDENQSEWADVVRWVTHGLVQAEEYGITSENIDEFIANNVDDNPDNYNNSAIRQFLGLEGNIGGSLGLSNDFIVNAIKAVGNYGEIYDRHFDSDLLRRGNNELAADFGLQYAPPFSGAGDANVVDGTPEDDNLEATNTSEHIYGYQGNDLIMAQDGSDLVYGGQGSDTVQAGNGNDYVWGNAGNDWLNGNQGNDRVNGGEGDDELYGGQGDDLLVGAAGNDTMTGGEGRDRFVLTPGSASNLITDFTDGEDWIVLEEGLTFEQLTIEPTANATIVKLDDEILATLNGIESSLITADDFNSTPI